VKRKTPRRENKTNNFVCITLLKLYNQHIMGEPGRDGLKDDLICLTRARVKKVIKYTFSYLDRFTSFRLRRLSIFIANRTERYGNVKNNRFYTYMIFNFFQHNHFLLIPYLAILCNRLTPAWHRLHTYRRSLSRQSGNFIFCCHQAPKVW